MYLRNRSVLDTCKGLPHGDTSCRSLILPNHSILTSGQPVPAQTLYLQLPCRVATGEPVTGMTQPRNGSMAKTGNEPSSAVLEAGALTTRPVRRSEAMVYVSTIATVALSVECG